MRSRESRIPIEILAESEWPAVRQQEMWILAADGLWTQKVSGLVGQLEGEKVIAGRAGVRGYPLFRCCDVCGEKFLRR